MAQISRNHGLCLVGEIRPEWGSQSSGDFRSLIRQNILKTLNASEDVLDLTHRPHVPGWSLSISHCPTAGGWVGVPSPNKIGLDLELESRLSLDTIRRVSTSDEIQAAPKPHWLWSAKEALYKARGGGRPISSFKVDSWEGVADIEWQSDRLIMAVALSQDEIPSQLSSRETEELITRT